jgi:hypothetical protein
MSDSNGDAGIPTPASNSGSNLPPSPPPSPDAAEETDTARKPQEDSTRPDPKMTAEMRHFLSKLRDDSTFNQLTPEQRETMEGWLFDENLGYAKTLERVKQEFGLEATISSLGRYYRRRARERQVEDLLDAQTGAFEVKDLPLNVPVMREALAKILYSAVLKQATEKPGEVEQLAALTKLLLASEENDILRQRLKLSERYFDYEATADSQKELPHMRAFLKVISDNNSLSQEEKAERVYGILYGWDKGNAGVAAQGKSEEEKPKEEA